ncbi:MAG: zinc ribbon domain-containing protein [Proteobacteria bacterium]|nr:zinc ribbon domain-containing protein [Pseudomonadota bacterium]
MRQQRSCGPVFRQWVCGECRCAHDRDVNAAKNILAAGGGVPRPCTGTTHRHASRRRAGHHVRARLRTARVGTAA